MSLGLSLTRPSDAKIARFLAEQEAMPVTYDAVGATRSGDRPKGFHVDHWAGPLGTGDVAFQRAKDGLRHWAAHAGAGVRVTPANAELSVGQTVALVVRTGGAWMLVACRVVWVLDEAEAFGFGYGTLPGHPECGEESFVVHRRSDDVVFDVDAISRARHPLAKLGGPVTRFLQAQTARGYLRGLREWVESAR